MGSRKEIQKPIFYTCLKVKKINIISQYNNKPYLGKRNITIFSTIDIVFCFE